MTKQTAPRSRTTTGVPLKVSKDTQVAVRYGAMAFGETQQAFMDRAVRAFLDEHEDEIKEKLKDIENILYSAR